ncbi:DUF1642 domain-containing protein [Lactobacillus rhamnosus]|uniref:DUF1642 domain-containing protein n=1 Tax=Lacticaseibacillus rhamnosus TaxID=47715 RepID=A0A7Y7QI13_LACRH|nr:DUF1642 domain-containing protein [Lacticaseibacillus rhamnosus]NVO89511.1 DUF1642 domain-containing protein [Lacticaseibacillus rhamnosus]
MSEEKIYLIKNDHGEYLTVERTAPWWNSPVGTAVRNIDVALAWAEKYGGHIVTFVEEPKKVVLTKEQAEIVEGAHDFEFPASYISRCNEDEELLMNAYVNGYTLEKEKKYNVKVPKKWSGDDKHYWTKEQDGTLTWAHLINNDCMTPYQQFTLTEIEHYSLQDCERVEIKQEDEK